MTGRLHTLYSDLGQSPWLDNLDRRWLASGELQRWIDLGIRGITSNPTIFAKSMSSSDAYDEDLRDLRRSGTSVADAYWHLAQDDVAAAADLFRPLYDESGGTDGFVSIEVDPNLAQDAAGTIAAGTELHRRLGRANVLIKVPATRAGLPAIRQLVTSGVNVNVTLIFSLVRYNEVMDAFLSGLEARQGSLAEVAGVASFFLSRVDTEVDNRISAKAATGAPPQGRTAVAQAKLAYEQFAQRFTGARWDALAARGARPQRPLWASTSTKNPAYPDTMYIDQLIGPHTVNTLPEAAVTAFLDHGTLARTIDHALDEAREHLLALAQAGVDLADVTDQLEREGVSAFAKSFVEVLATLASKPDVG